MATKLRRPLLASVALLAACAGARSSAAAEPAASAPAPTQSPPAAAAAPAEGAAGAQKGGGKKLNKFTGNPAAVKEGRALYLQYGCSGCHGVGGGGGMAPPITDDVWKFGSDDGTLFKLIKGQIAEQTMPKVYANLPDEEVWKILAYVRSVYAGDPQKADW
jgi:cytochrome c(L)